MIRFLLALPLLHDSPILHLHFTFMSVITRSVPSYTLSLTFPLAVTESGKVTRIIALLPAGLPFSDVIPEPYSSRLNLACFLYPSIICPAAVSTVGPWGAAGSGKTFYLHRVFWFAFHYGRAVLVKYN